jgi:hypothetical protein
LTPTRSTEKWHVGKEIPLAMIFGMMIQTSGVIWWAASLSAKLDYLTEQVASLQHDRGRQENSFKDIAVIEQRLDTNERRILILEARKFR